MNEPHILTTEPVVVAFISMHGPYSQIPEGLGRLYVWVGARNLLPTGMPMAVYFTPPGEAPEDDALWELRAPVTSDSAEVPPDDSGIGVKRIESTTVAAVIHKGSYDSIPPTYEMLWRWVEENGYVPDGPPLEIYYSDPARVPPEEYLTEIQLPVRRA